MKLRPAFETPDGKPHVQQSIVAFFDILGFTAEIRRATEEKRVDAYLQKIAGVVKQWYDLIRDEFMTEHRSQRFWEVKTFTDNVVIGHPIVRGGESEFGGVMNQVAMLQLGFALEGLFVRGGIAVGDLYMDDDLVFGVGLLDAVASEKAADVPRVVLNEPATEMVKQHLKSYLYAEDAPQSSDLLRDEDGRLFLNYLGEAWQDHTEQPDYSIVDQHRKIVSERLSAFRASPRVWSKYSWVARYHNYACTEFLPGAEDYRIDVDLLSLRAARIHDV